MRKVLGSSRQRADLCNSSRESMLLAVVSVVFGVVLVKLVASVYADQCVAWYADLGKLYRDARGARTGRSRSR